MPITAVKRRQLRDPNKSQDPEYYTPPQIPLLSRAENLLVMSSAFSSTPQSTPNAALSSSFPPQAQQQELDEDTVPREDRDQPALDEDDDVDHVLETFDTKREISWL